VSRLDNVFDATLALNKLYGDIMIWKLPAIGEGLMIADPNEFMKVMEHQSKWPLGAVEQQWPVKKALEPTEFHTTKKFFRSGEEWSDLRSKYAKNLLSPKVLKGYVPGLSETARRVTEVFPRYADNPTMFTACASFDMFCNVMFGKMLDATRETSEGDSRTEFCNLMRKTNEELVPFMMKPYEAIMAMMLNVDTERMRNYRKMWIDALAQSGNFVDDFVERRERGELSEIEKRSYLAVNLDKREEDHTDLSVQELKEIASVLLSVSIDTTSAIMNWNLVTLALYPEVQEKARQEVMAAESITKAVMDNGRKGSFPYLNAVIRETHRVRNPVLTPMVKKPNTDVEIGGYLVPKDTMVTFDAYSFSNNLDILPDAREFKPERWLPEAVAERVGTPSEAIDHPLLRAPFSAGARMCPGSRVAQREVVLLLAHLLKRWRFSFEDAPSLADIKSMQYSLVQPIDLPKLVITDA